MTISIANRAANRPEGAKTVHVYGKIVLLWNCNKIPKMKSFLRNKNDGISQA
jgi:hypothetical protein